MPSIATQPVSKTPPLVLEHSLATSTGYGNTANGTDALHYNTTGHYNTATGVNALHEQHNGFSNTASGFDVLYNNTTGFNRRPGYALFSNTTGDRNNTARSGIIALYDNTTGYDNTAIGSCGAL